MKWFNENQINSLNDLKDAYRILIKKHHPDAGGRTADMQEINNEYDELFPIYKARHNEAAAAGKGSVTLEGMDDFKQIMEVLIHLDGLTVELCGSWLWIGGDTRQHKDALKSAGCHWCSKKKLWSWHPKTESTGGRKPKSMAYIRMKYGSATVRRPEERLGLA